MSSEYRRIAIYVAMALVSMAVFQYAQPRKVATSIQTKEAIADSQNKIEHLKATQLGLEKKQTLLLENQKTMIAELLRQRECQAMLLDSQKVLLDSLKSPLEYGSPK